MENGLVAPETTQVKPAVVSGTSVTEDRAITADGSDEVTKVGMECGIKHLYQKEDERGRFTWTDKYPENLDEAAENEITARYAILVRNKKSFDSRKKLEIDSIVVQSPLLKSVLSKVLKDYPGITHNQVLFRLSNTHLRCHTNPQTTHLPGTIQPIRSPMDSIYESPR